MSAYLYLARYKGRATNARSSDREYSHGIVAALPGDPGELRLVACCRDEAAARMVAARASCGKGNTAATWRAYREGARFIVAELERIETSHADEDARQDFDARR